MYPLNLGVDQQDIVDINNQHLYFSNHEEQYFVAIICTWSFNDVHKGFEDHAYMNDLDSMINNFYHQLFTHQIFVFNLDKDHVLLFQIFLMYYCRR